MRSNQCLAQLCGLLAVVLGSCSVAMGDCNCPRLLYMTVPAGNQTYYYYMSTRYDDSVSPCIPKTTTTMYSSSMLDVSSVCCTGDCIQVRPPHEGDAADETPDAKLTPRRVEPIDPGNLKKSYKAKIGLQICPSGMDCWQMISLGEWDSFYFRLEREDHSTVWVEALVHKVKYKVTSTSGEVSKKIIYIANGLEIQGEPPANAEVLSDVVVGKQVSGHTHLYRVTAGGFDFTTITTEVRP